MADETDNQPDIGEAGQRPVHRLAEVAAVSGMPDYVCRRWTDFLAPRMSEGLRSRASSNRRLYTDGDLQLLVQVGQYLRQGLTPKEVANKVAPGLKGRYPNTRLSTLSSSDSLPASAESPAAAPAAPPEHTPDAPVELPITPIDDGSAGSWREIWKEIRRPQQNGELPAGEGASLEVQGTNGHAGNRQPRPSAAYAGPRSTVAGAPPWLANGRGDQAQQPPPSPIRDEVADAATLTLLRLFHANSDLKFLESLPADERRRLLEARRLLLMGRRLASPDSEHAAITAALRCTEEALGVEGQTATPPAVHPDMTRELREQQTAFLRDEIGSSFERLAALAERTIASSEQVISTLRHETDERVDRIRSGWETIRDGLVAELAGSQQRLHDELKGELGEIRAGEQYLLRVLRQIEARVGAQHERLLAAKDETIAAKDALIAALQSQSRA